MCASRLIVTPVLLPAVFSGIAPGQVIATTASASMTGGRRYPSPGPSDALGYPV